MYVPPLGQYITDGRGRTSGAGVTRRVRKPRPVRGGGRKGGEFHGMGLVIILEPRLDAPWDGIFSPGSARGSNSSAASKEIQQEDRQIAARSSGNGAELSHKHIGQSKDHIG